jgi:hypothetical protein
VRQVERGPGGRYERTDIRPRIVLAGALGLLVALLLTLVIITLLEAVWTGIPPSVSRPEELIEGRQAAPTPAAPRLEAQPGQDFPAYRAASEQKLNAYRWVDRNSGTVAIPIDRAIDIVAQRGLATRNNAATSRVTSPTSASSGRVEAPYP